MPAPYRRETTFDRSRESRKNPPVEIDDEPTSETESLLSLKSRAFVPTAQWIEELEVGDEAPNCFGNIRTVASITYRGTNPRGQLYVGVYLWLSKEHGSKISESFVAGQPHITINQ